MGKWLSSVQLKIFMVVFVMLCSVSVTLAEQNTFKVILDEPVNGSIQLTPKLPQDSSYKAGTVVKVQVVPDEGYAIDAGYFSVPGRWGQMPTEFPEAKKFKVVMDQEKHIGATFIKKADAEGFSVIQDIVYAQLGVKPLKYDVYKPDGAKDLPIVVIIHGGGWTTNNEDIMRELARQLVRTGQYVVCSIDYRWAGKADGDEVPNIMADLIADVFGAIAHIQEHAAKYGGDLSKIAVTGDSAGGHLSASAAVMPEMIGEGGFGDTEGVFEYLPSYVPKDKSVAQVRQEILDAIKAAAPSYGVFADLMTFSEEHAEDKSWKDAVSPINHIPDIKQRAVPHFLLRGTSDFLIRNDMVQIYVDALQAAGQRAEYIQVPEAGHAFFDWKPDPRVRATFVKYGVPYSAQMKAFFDTVFYADK